MTSDDLPSYGSVPPQPPGPPGAPEASDTAPEQNKKALWSMILGIMAMVGLCCTIGGALGIPAVILGVIGRSEVAASEGRQAGTGHANAGIVTGAVAAFVAIVMIIVYANNGAISGNITIG